MKKAVLILALTEIALGVFMVWCSAHIHYAVKLAVCVVGAAAAYMLVSPYAVDGVKRGGGVSVPAKKSGASLRVKRIAAAAVLFALGAAEIAASYTAINHRVNYGTWSVFCNASHEARIDGFNYNNNGGSGGDSVPPVPVFDGGINLGEAGNN